MSLGSSKADVRKLIYANWATYADARTGRASIRDWTEFGVIPFVFAVLLCVFDVTLRPVASVGLLTISGLLSAFLFGVMLQVSDRAMTWADLSPERGRSTSEHADFLRELAANA